MARTWLITGCSRGLGHALAKAVIGGGDRLVATARDPNDLADLVTLGGDRVVAASLDVTDSSAAEKVVATAVDRFGGLDVVVNNAGYGNVAPIENTSLDDFRAQIETNLFGAIIVTKAAIPLFREQRSGRFIQVSSIGGPCWRHWTCALFRGEVRCRGVLGGARYRNGAAGRPRPRSSSLAVSARILPGFSTQINAGDPAYAATVGKTAAMQRDYDGKQPGDPQRAAQAILAVSRSETPPLRLVLGRDAYARAEQNDEARLTELRSSRDVSISTDFSYDQVG